MLGGETSAPLFIFVMRSRTGTSALSALPVRLKAGAIFLFANRKSYFLSEISGYNVKFLHMLKGDIFCIT